MNVFAFGQKIFQQLHRYYLIDICGVRMCSSRRRDFNFLCEEFDEEFNKKTDDRNFLDLEDGLDGILSQSLDVFEEQRSCLESPRLHHGKKGKSLKFCIKNLARYQIREG